MNLHDSAANTCYELIPPTGVKPNKRSLATHVDKIESVSRQIFDIIMRARRTHISKKQCEWTSCNKCQDSHLDNIMRAVAENRSILFVLPAFPGKSPNPRKVLGTLPDKAEELALRFLNNLCQRIQQIYPPGSHIKLCSDGQVFSDVVGIKEIDVSTYQAKIKYIIKDLHLNHLSVFSLDDINENSDFHKMREQLMYRYGESTTTLRKKY